MGTIWMPLDDEGTDVWAPVPAENLGDGRFRIIGPMPDHETWRFIPGSIVTVRSRRFSDGSEGPEAVEISK